MTRSPRRESSANSTFVISHRPGDSRSAVPCPPDLRERFQTVDNFMAMVRDRYPAVYRPSQVTFGALENSDGSIVQHVLVVGPDGNLHEALYFMERQKDGTWLIDGCLLIESDLKSS